MMAIKCEQGGKGHGVTKPQGILLDALNAAYPMDGGWIPEYVIPTRKGYPYPRHYSVDVMHVGLGIAVEVDGASHRHPLVKKADRRKTALLRKMGYSVVRVSNSQVYADVNRVVRFIGGIVKKRISKGRVSDVEG